MLTPTLLLGSDRVVRVLVFLDNIRSTINRNRCCLNGGFRNPPGAKSTNRVDAQLSLVEIDEALTEPKRSAHIWSEDADSLLEQRLVITSEAGLFLSFRSAMKAQNMSSGGVLGTI